MSASGSENNVNDNAKAQADQMRAEVEAEDPISFEQAMKALDEKMDDQAWADAPEDTEAPLLFATIQYEEGTSGPLKVAAGLLVEDDAGITIIDPEDGVATSIGDRFIIRVDVQQVEVGDEDEDEGDDE